MQIRQCCLEKTVLVIITIFCRGCQNYGLLCIRASDNILSWYIINLLYLPHLYKTLPHRFIFSSTWLHYVLYRSSFCDREVVCSVWYHQGSNFVSCVRGGGVASDHPQGVLWSSIACMFTKSAPFIYSFLINIITPKEYVVLCHPVDPMLGWCWPSVVDGGPTLVQQLIDVMCANVKLFLVMCHTLVIFIDRFCRSIMSVDIFYSVVSSA